MDTAAQSDVNQAGGLHNNCKRYRFIDFLNIRETASTFCSKEALAAMFALNFLRKITQRAGDRAVWRSSHLSTGLGRFPVRGMDDVKDHLRAGGNGVDDWLPAAGIFVGGILHQNISSSQMPWYVRMGSVRTPQTELTTLPLGPQQTST